MSKREIFTKEQVRNMTSAEISKNADNILRSMRQWENEEQEKVEKDGEPE